MTIKELQELRKCIQEVMNVKIKRAIREIEEYRENLFTPTDEFMMDKEIEILKFILGEEYYD